MAIKKLKADLEYQTRMGKRVKILAIFLENDPGFEAIGVIHEDGKWRESAWAIDGMYAEKGISDDDIIREWPIA